MQHDFFSVDLVIFFTIPTLIVKDANAFREIHKYQHEIDLLFNPRNTIGYHFDI